LHLSIFQIVDRQPFTVVNGDIVPSGSAAPPAAWESGWKDTVLVNPFEIVRVIVPFEDYAGYYPFHCHVLEHEDHDMMRQFQTRTNLIFSNGFEVP
ncbi:MAG TPA: multicopper oxidase domain-containing protein, partial [Rudaea sp.]|nr:multicopper oxidase domain-containing protein [Rudaea sp.]